MKQKTVIIIVGPTASGKTSLSVDIAGRFGTDIISADSRQCFKELNIGVAKPPDGALRSIKHYFINSHSIHDSVNAQVFESYALTAVNEIFKHNDTAVMVGGTGMYIKAFCEGFDAIPEIDPSIRNKILQKYDEKGLLWLQQEVQKKDPVFWERAEQQNPQRLMRALEVIRATGNSIITYRKNEKKKRSFNIIKIGIDLPKHQLHANINNRVDEMIVSGLVAEVETLLLFKELNALQTVGYTEIFNYLEGKTSLEESIRMIKASTRSYAKRQLTWFKKDKSVKWFNCLGDVKRLSNNTLLSRI